MTRISVPVDAIVDPLAVTVRVNQAGQARFDVSGVPRVDPLLVGRPAASVPALVTRLCGLCPVTHHLAGIAALDQLTAAELSPTARAVRALLHHGSVLDVMGPRLDPAHALQLKKFGKLTLAAAGCPGHFPDVAVPGGVRAAADPAQVSLLAEQLPEVEGLVAAAVSHAEHAAEGNAGSRPLAPTARLDVTVGNGDGGWDPLGNVLCVGAERVPAGEIPQRIRETQPGAITPRPEIQRADGSWHTYRVGPSARFPQQDSAVAQARAVEESLRAIAELVRDPKLRAILCDSGAVPAATATDDAAEPVLHDGIGVGLVDGPRGLLVHEYEVKDGILTRARILSPTAQNEGWLAEMLTQCYAEGGDPSAMARRMEEPIRAADPCLPCTSAPRGMMNITIEEE